jgi:hypothetical protein
MPVEVTRFDSFLKEKLYRDILFRIALWLSIAALTARVATEKISSLEYFGRLVQTLMPVLTEVMWWTMFLSVPALVLKELEFVDPVRWRSDSPIAMSGGAVRRLAGDLSLWVIGAIVTLVSATAMVTSDALFDTSSRGAGFLAIVWVAALFGLVLMSIVNVHVRRAEPIFAGQKGFEWVRKPRHVLTCYGLVLFLALLAYRYG